MDIVENYWHNFDVIKDGLMEIYNRVSHKLSRKRMVIPIASVMFFYYFFIREVEGKRKKRIMKKPCPSDREYDTSDDHPYIPVVRFFCRHFVCFINAEI